MQSQLCLTADIGTSSIKAGIINSRGELICSSYASIYYPGGQFDRLHPDELLRAFAEVVQQLEARQRISGLAISGNGPSLVPVDAHGQHLDTVLMWLDKRDLRLDGGKSFFLPKAAWLRENQPDTFARTSRFLSVAEYLVFKLTGEEHTASPSEKFDPFFWSRQDHDLYTLSGGLFAGFRRAGDIVGYLQQSPAEQLGLPSGIPAAAAGSDFLMSLLGTASVKPGMVCDRAGSSEGINYCVDTPIHDSRLRTLPHAVPGLWNVAGILSSTGLLFEWFRRFTGMSGVAYHDMLHMIAGVERPVPWFFPTLHSGASWEFHHGMFSGLGAGHGAAEMGRAVVDSIGYAVRETVEILSAAAGPVDVMRCCGGQARNAIWNQIKADMSGVSLEIPAVPEAELQGNAACCFTALGLYRDVAEAAQAMVHIVRRYDPDPRVADRYTADYQAYTAAYAAVRRIAADF